MGAWGARGRGYALAAAHSPQNSQCILKLPSYSTAASELLTHAEFAVNCFPVMLLISAAVVAMGLTYSSACKSLFSV